MRIINVVYRQHIDRMFKKHWIVQGQRIPIDTGAETHLKSLGIPVVDPNEIVKEKRERLDLNIIGLVPKPIKNDHTHPDWNDKICYFHRDDNVLLQGLKQAKILTKSVEILEGLPQTFQNAAEPSPEINKRVQNIVLSSHLFDPEQQKLPKKKDPNRPAWNYPRVLGITYSRICQLITSKLLQICETNVKGVANDRLVLNNAQFFFPFTKEEDNILLELSADQLLLSKKPLSNFTMANAENIDLPNLHPIHYTITLTPENIYKFQNIYPIKNNVLKYHPHTVFIYFDTTKVQNLYQEEVTEDQILGRSLMKTFTAAASYARAKFGEDVKLLPEPVSLQCVHTDGKMFHFGALQLNTLDLNDGDVKNVWYMLPRIPLFKSCEYRTGKPYLEGYNPNVIKYMLAYYSNL